jgi:phosphopantetheinyl transferase
LAKELLCEFANGQPGDWQLASVAGQAPTVERGLAALHVSIAHRGRWVVAAVATSPVGVDVEIPARIENAEARAELICSPSEKRMYGELLEADRPALLRTLWTLKEAWAKSRCIPFNAADWQRVSSQSAPETCANARVYRLHEATVALVSDCSVLSALSSASSWAFGGVAESFAVCGLSRLGSGLANRAGKYVDVSIST